MTIVKNGRRPFSLAIASSSFYTLRPFSVCRPSRACIKHCLFFIIRRANCNLLLLTYNGNFKRIFYPNHIHRAHLKLFGLKCKCKPIFRRYIHFTLKTVTIYRQRIAEFFFYLWICFQKHEYIYYIVYLLQAGQWDARKFKKNNRMFVGS